MVNDNTAMDEQYMGERIVLILLGAISGVLSIAILTEYIQANQWLSPILGVLAILLLMGGGLLGSQDRDSKHRQTM